MAIPKQRRTPNKDRNTRAMENRLLQVSAERDRFKVRAGVYFSTLRDFLESSKSLFSRISLDARDEVFISAEWNRFSVSYDRACILIGEKPVL